MSISISHDQAVDGEGHILGDVDHMGGDVPQGPRAGNVLLEPPGQGRGGVGGPALEVGAPHVEELPERALVDELLGQVDGWHPPVLVGVHVDDAPGIGLLGGFRHGLGVLQCGGDGLLAEHVLSGVQGGNGDLGVGVVGRAHAHHVDLRVVDDVPPVGAALLISLHLNDHPSRISER